MKSETSGGYRDRQLVGVSAGIQNQDQLTKNKLISTNPGLLTSHFTVSIKMAIMDTS